MSIIEGIKKSTEIIQIVKDFPFWILFAISASLSAYLYYCPSEYILPSSEIKWVILAAVIVSGLTIGRFIHVIYNWLIIHSRLLKSQRPFHLISQQTECYWHVSKQSDGSLITQFSAAFVAKNRTKDPISLISTRLIKPSISGDVIQNLVLVRARDRNLYGSCLEGYTILPNETLPINILILIRGVPRKNVSKSIRAILGITDSDGNEQKIKAVFKEVNKSNESKPKINLEIPFMIADPIEKEIVSVLQAEIDRYMKCGRSMGGFGSIYISYQNRNIISFGQDMWKSNSSENQAIIMNPETAFIQSDNLNALLAFYNKLIEVDQKHFVRMLIERINENKGYLSVSYFIVCTLFKLGYFEEALSKVKSLPKNEIKDFGLSNVLMMLNGFLRYCHDDFSMEMLDKIEELSHDLDEPIFKISEKIRAIRTLRLLSSTKSTHTLPGVDVKINSLKIVIKGESGHDRIEKSERAITKNKFISVKNIGNTFITNCDFFLEFFCKKDNKFKKYRLQNSFDIFSGASRFIQIAYCHEYLANKENERYRFGLAVPPTGAFFDESTILSKEETYSITLSIESLGQQIYKSYYKLWMAKNNLISLELAE